VTGPEGLISPDVIRHFDLHSKEMTNEEGWLPSHRPLTVLLTAGASCPDILLDRVMERLCEWETDCRETEDVLASFNPVS
jgi:4-hydroxy-3-methylbut-2-enyl diphosphate reductase